MTARHDGQERKSAWIPWAFVGFFGFVFAVNGVMVYFALTTFTGLAVDQPYDRGLRYNTEIAGAEAQRNLGWRPAVDFAQTDARAGTLSLALTDGAGTGVNGAEVMAELVRPTHQGHDFAIPLSASGDGRYQASFEVPLSGVWEVRIIARRDGGAYRVHERIFVR